MEQVILRIVRDDGLEFYIDNRVWMIPNDGLENWANLPHSVSVQENASYDGGVVTNRRIETVDRSVHAELANPADNAAKRLEAIRFFSPKHTYEAHLTYQGRTLWCAGEQYAFKCETGNIYQPVTFDWTILCPMPYLLGEDNFGKDVAFITAKFGFPYHSVVRSTPAGVYKRGFAMGVYDFNKTVDIQNDGDVTTFPRVVIRADGTVENPKISIGDKFVRFVGTLQQNDELVIDFEQRPPRVTLNGKNAINKVDRASSFTSFQIEAGDTTFEYDADSGENVMSVSLYYWKRYLGI